jgi:glycosyltransferase involved in cell wall biosynthesis
MESGTPAASVIIQTFNRSNILGCVIDSVLAQTHADFDLIVVGDACTDDSEAVVGRCVDPRVRSVNRPENVGDQSGATNEGMRFARGRYVALLNHDDFFFPDHPAQAIATLERTRADFTYTLQLEADPDGGWRVNATYQDVGFDPVLHPNASTWVFRRELFARIGPFVRRDRVFTYPTRDWLWRAYRQGVSMVPTPAVTVIVVLPTTRRNVYPERQFHEHEAIARAMREGPDFPERCLVRAWQNPRPTHLRSYGARHLWRALGMRAAGRVAPAVDRSAVRESRADQGRAPSRPRICVRVARSLAPVARYGRDSLFVGGRPAAERRRPPPLLTSRFDPPRLAGGGASMFTMSVNRARGFAV